MRARSLLVAVVAATVAATAAPALSETTTVRRCGTVTFDGKPLPVYAEGVSCTAARALLTKLAKLPHPGRPIHVYPGRYSGMLCMYSNQIDNKVGVLCNNASHTKMVSAGKKSG